MGDTPRTDALIAGHPSTPGLRELADSYNQLLDFARALERELAAKEEQITALRRWLRDRAYFMGNCWGLGYVKVTEPDRALIDSAIDAAILEDSKTNASQVTD